MLIGKIQKWILFSFLVTQIVYAQESSVSAETQSVVTPPATTTEDSESKQVERVEVIGTRIKRIVKEGTTPVKSVGKDTMTKSANTSASDSMRDSTLATYGVGREASGSNAAATTSIGLRGLGSTRTLVLLNGNRLPKDPATESVDLNLIPQSAIERIEVLKDGASALYGSDALGGVINIVTKKGYVGNEATIKMSTPEEKGGAAYDVSMLSGRSSEKSDFMAVLSYNRQDKIYGRDRDLTSKQLTSLSNQAVWYDNLDNINFEPGCDPSLLAPNGMCYYRFNDIATIRPQISQLNLLTDYTYRLGSGIKLYNRNIIVHKDIKWMFAPTPGTVETSTGTTSQPTAREIMYRFTDAGNRDNEDSELNFSTLFGIKGNLTSIWDYDVSMGYSQIHRKNKGVNGYLDKTIIKQLMENGLYDPMAPVNKGDISSAVVQTYQSAKSNLLTVEAIATGEIAELEHGAIGVAAGVSVMNEKLDQSADDRSMAGQVLGSSGSNDQGGRDVQSAFAEVLVPVRKNLELNAAARMDHYSDFGVTVNPKLSAKYTINEMSLIRSSVGTGFKAPTLSELYGASSNGYISFIDRKKCATDPNYCTSRQYLVLGGGNKDLKEEKAFTASLGAVIQPVSNFSFSLDGWYTKVKNIVGIDYDALTEVELAGGSTGAVTVTRNPDGTIKEIYAPNLNLQSEELAGIDFNAEIGLANSFYGHQLVLENDFSYMIFDKIEGFPGAGTRNVIGEWGMPIWRNSTSLSMKNDVSTYSITMRSIPGQNVVDRLKDQKISDSTEFDVAGSYNLSKQTTLAGGVKNILDAAQPADMLGGTGKTPVINNSLYDVNGRKFFVSYSQKF